MLIDQANITVSQIPWTHRREMGRFRAFRRTVWLTLRHPKRLAADISRPVSLTNARKFQNIVVWLTFVPIAAVLLWPYFATLRERLSTESIGMGPFDTPRNLPPTAISNTLRYLGWAFEGLGVVIAGFCLWCFLKSITGVASYFCHPHQMSTARQNRAISLSYYASAPLAWTPITIGLIPLIIAMADASSYHHERFRYVMLLAGLAFLSAGVQITAWWRCSLVLLKHTTRSGGLRLAVIASLLPVFWLILAGLLLGVLPASYMFLCVVILSYF